MKADSIWPITPRILRREVAALYLGMSPATLDTEVKEGRAPAPVQVTSGVKGWDRHDLDMWIEARKADAGLDANEWDAA